MNACCCETSGGVCGEDHMHSFRYPRRVEHGGKWMDVLKSTVDNIETGWRIHPTVYQSDEDRRQQSTQGHHDPEKKCNQPGTRLQP